MTTNSHFVTNEGNIVRYHTLGFLQGRKQIT